MTEITREIKTVYRYNKKPYLTLYAACFAKAKTLAVEKYFNPIDDRGDSGDSYSCIKEEYHSRLINKGDYGYPPSFNTFAWNKCKREIAKDLLYKEKSKVL